MSEKYPAYTVKKDLPGWVEKGHTQFQNQHAGPAELAKDILTQSSIIGHSFHDLMEAGNFFYAGLKPEVVWEWTTKYSDIFLDEIQSLGKTLIQVVWSCGFSTPSEEIQRKIIIEFTRKAHIRGIKICAYLSLTNIFWKDTFEHEPQLKNVLARYSNGDPVLYGYSQARYLACVNQPEWLKYLKNKVRMAIKEADVDAIYFDNLSARCTCNICKSLFAEFTERLTGKRYNLPLIEQSLPPEVKREDEKEDFLIVEKIRQNGIGEDEEICRGYLCRRFEAYRIAEALKEIRDYAFELKFPLVFSANNHLLPFINDLCNVLYSQDTNTPGPVWDNIPILRYMSADSDGWKPVVTNHPLQDADPRLSMAEAMAFQSYPYGITYKHYNIFYDKYPELFSHVQPIARIGILLEWPKRISNYLKPLGMNNLLYEVIVPDKWTKDTLDKYKVIILPDLEAVSDGLFNALNDFAANGGKIFATGKSMLYDGYGRRRKGGINQFYERVDVEGSFSSDILGRIRRASNPQYIEVDAPDLVTVNLVRKTDNSAYILHVLNYNNRECGPVKIRLNIPDRSFSRAVLLSPDKSTVQEELFSSNNMALLIDTIDVYSIITLR